MKNLFLFLSTLLLMSFYNLSYAAFPVQPQSAPEVVAPGSTVLSGFNEKVNAAIDKLTKPLPAVQRGGSGDGTIGLVSFGLGLLGMAFLFSSVPLLGIIGIACGIGAIITGAMGLKQRNRGFAIAGLVLGILEVLILILAVVLVASLLD